MAQAEQKQPEYHGKIVRILSKDIDGNLKVYPGLTKIKGISWGFSNAICNSLNIDKNKKIDALTEEEINKITEFVKSPDLPVFILNKRFDFETGENSHLTGTDLDLKNEFEIKRLKKIKSYRGGRHQAGLPMRGQRTKGHFRKNKAKSVGIKKKNK